MWKKIWLCLAAWILAACNTSTPTATLTPVLPTAQAAISTSTAPSPTVAATATPAPAPTEVPPTAIPTPTLHVVQAGENLFRIALRYSVTVEALRVVNGLTSDVIYVGQTLYIPPPPEPTVNFPLPTPTTAAVGLSVQTFTVGPNPVAHNATLNIAWNVPGAAHVTIWPQVYDRKTGRWYRIPENSTGYFFRAPLGTGAASGNLALTIPTDASLPMQFELEATDTAGGKLTATSELIKIACAPSIAAIGGCPLTAQTAEGAYQIFERGYLVWRGDTQEVLILSTNPAYFVPWSLQAILAQPSSLAAPPAGLYPPSERFAATWAIQQLEAGVLNVAAPELRSLSVGEILGWATAPEQTYTLSAQYHLDNTDDDMFQDWLVLSLPNNKFVSVMPHERLVLTTGPTWGFITPP